MEHTTAPTSSATTRRYARAPHTRRALIFAVSFIVGIGAGCDSGTDSRSSTPTTPLVPSTSATTAEASSPDTAAPEITEPDSTVSPTSSASEPTTAAPTTPAAVPATWVAVGLPEGKYSQGSFDPYGTWVGEPSPQFPATATDALANGFYPAFLAAPWLAEQPGSLSIVVRRLESCSVAGMVEKSDSCDAGEAIGVDIDSMFEMTVPLDGSVTVVLLGTDCSVGADDQVVTVVKAGDGASIRALFEDYTASYDAVIGPKLASAPDVFRIVAEVAAAPAGGFTAAGERCDSSLAFNANDAPPVLLQGLVALERAADGSFQALTASDAISLNSVDVTDGVTTLYFYAGFRS